MPSLSPALHSQATDADRLLLALPTRVLNTLISVLLPSPVESGKLSAHAHWHAANSLLLLCSVPKDVATGGEEACG